MLKSQDLKQTLAEAIDPDAFASGDEGRKAVAYAAAARAASVIERIMRLVVREAING